MLGGVQGAGPRSGCHPRVIEQRLVDHVPQSAGAQPDGRELERLCAQDLAGGHGPALVAGHPLAHLHGAQMQLGPPHPMPLLVVEDPQVGL